MTDLLIIASCIFMLCFTAHTACSLIFCDRKTRCRRIKEYKNGKFFAPYIAAFPLYAVAYHSSGLKIAHTLQASLNSTLEMTVFKFDLDVIVPMTENSILFTVAIYSCMLFMVCNMLLFSASIFFRRVSNHFRVRSLKKGKRDVCVVFGYGEKQKLLISSLPENTDILVLTHETGDEFTEDMYALHAAYLPLEENDNIASVIKNRISGFDTRHCSVFLLCDTEDENLNYSYQLSELAAELGDLAGSNDGKRGLDIYVFSENAADTLYKDIIRRSHGALHCVNRYKMLSADFTLAFPITEFIPECIDTTKAALDKDTDYRIIMIGFGKAARQLFRTYTQNNQCLIDGDNGIEEMPLSYTIFDKTDTRHDATLNHTYLHYSRWLNEERDEDDYFAMPPLPAKVSFRKEDINSNEFFDDLHSSLTNSEKGFNMIIVSLGDDIKALDLSEKILEDIREWNLEGNTGIFVRIKSATLTHHLRSKYTVPFIIPFGDNESLYSYQRIVNPSVEGMAKDRHICYTAEGCNGDATDADIKKKALEKWMFGWEEIQRESNVFACLSIRLRLNLLGFDLAEKSSDLPDAAEEYMAAYQRNNEIEYLDKTVNGKKIVNYDGKYCAENAPRDVLARAEHQRWNAYMICNGFVPASKSEFIRDGKASLMRKRKHINITTFEGLNEYAFWRMKNEDISFNDADVIRYDYQLMDDLPWLLDRSGFKIVRRTFPNQAQ